MSVAGTDRIALTGANGSGKSTLMRIMTGELRPDSGRVVRSADTRVSYLPQSGVRHGGRTVAEEADAAFDDLRILVSELDALGAELESAQAEDRETTGRVRRHAEITERLRISGFWDREQAIHRVLTGLGFAESDFGRATTEFSSGWQMRIALAKVLLEGPDVLLLDEPTNYLDIEARDWLEDYLRAYSGAVMIVSHDRYFLDQVVDRVAELYLGAVSLYRGTFTEYESRRRKELEAILSAYEQQQEEIQKTEDFVRRFRSNASKASLVQSRVKQLEKMERIEVPEALKRVHITFPPAPHSGRSVLTLRGVSRRYSDTVAVEDLDLHLERGEKLVIVGPNGAGKSTLMRIIAGFDNQYDGSRQTGAGVSIGYFSQDAVDTPAASETVFENVSQSASERSEGELRNLLGAFLFHGDDAFKPISVLSGGERSRLELLKLLLSPRNLLVLDEPTNHLDMTSKSVLLDALKGYTGSVVFVSHDRYFIDALAGRVLELRPPHAGKPRARHFPGDYEYYRERIQAEEAKEGSESGAGTSGTSADGKSAGGVVEDTPAGKLDHAESKRRRNEVRRLAREEETLLSDIETAEGRRGDLEGELAQPEVYSDGERVKAIQMQLAELDESIATLHEQWERVSEQLEEYQEYQ